MRVKIVIIEPDNEYIRIMRDILSTPHPKMIEQRILTQILSNRNTTPTFLRELSKRGFSVPEKRKERHWIVKSMKRAQFDRKNYLEYKAKEPPLRPWHSYSPYILFTHKSNDSAVDEKIVEAHPHLCWDYSAFLGLCSCHKFSLEFLFRHLFKIIASHYFYHYRGIDSYLFENDDGELMVRARGEEIALKEIYRRDEELFQRHLSSLSWSEAFLRTFRELRYDNFNILEEILHCFISHPQMTQKIAEEHESFFSKNRAILFRIHRFNLEEWFQKFPLLPDETFALASSPHLSYPLFLKYRERFSDDILVVIAMNNLKKTSELSRRVILDAYRAFVERRENGKKLIAMKVLQDVLPMDLVLKIINL